VARKVKIDGATVRARVLAEGVDIKLTRGEIIALGSMYPNKHMKICADPKKYLGNKLDAAVRRGRSEGRVRKDRVRFDEHGTITAAEALTWLRRALGMKLADLPPGAPVRFERTVLERRARISATARAVTLPPTLEECRAVILRQDDLVYRLERENAELKAKLTKLTRKPSPRNAQGQFEDRVK
jgi:hypothetical protein